VANKLLIVHGYSDGRTSFTGLGDYLTQRGVYTRENLFYLNYSSMDDEATFHDFADKLDADYRARFDGERLDVICHSTGSLVVRSWLALHSARAKRRGIRDQVICPVDRLVCLAPANFGSDLARLGQSFLGRFRSTFFNKNSNKGDAGESGKIVLEGLEPASPFQWDLSFMYDLHADHSYFRPSENPQQICYPFVLSAGEAYTGLEARLLEPRGRLGTDGTVRIAGTSMNTRACTLDFRPEGAVIKWWDEYKFARIPFAVFAGVNHGTIIDGTRPDYGEPNRPGAIIEAVLKDPVTTPEQYAGLAETFDQVSAWNYQQLPEERRGKYQQFFFRVQDDVDHLLEDYHIDFYVEGPDGEPHEALTLQFDTDFEAHVTTHSTTRSYRVYMMNCSNLGSFGAELVANQARLVLEITGVSTLPDVRYVTSRYVAYDPAAPDSGAPSLLFPNTTTLINVALNRVQTNRLLSIDPPASSVTVSEAEDLPLTGRAKLIANAAAREDPASASSRVK
jgi:hypothetical protein